MRTIATALLLALFLGCSKEPSSSSSSSSSPSKQTTWSIHASTGGVAGDASGAQVTFPADAVRDNFDVALTSSEGDKHASPGVRVAGQVWSVSIDNKDHFTFEKPVRLSIPIDRSRAVAGRTIALSVWNDGRWQNVQRSRVEGDRIVAEVDHFSDYAPTQDDAGGGPAPDADARERWLNAESWHGSVHIAIYGHGRRASGGSRTSYSISRDAQVTFRIPQIPGEAESVRAMEQIEKSGIKLKTDDMKQLKEQMEKARSVRHWMTPWGGAATDEDKTDFKFGVNDRYDGNDSGGGCGEPDDVEQHGTLVGGQSEHVLAMHQLEIDLGKGTYTFSFNHKPEAKLTLIESGTGMPAKTLELPSFVGYRLVDRPLPSEGSVLAGTMKIERKDFEKYIGQIPSGWTWDFGSLRGSITWTLSPGPPLLARIGAPYVSRRGDTVTLDGSGSLGQITGYRWRVKVDAGCPGAPESPIEYTGAKVSFRALWNFTAHLEVTGAAGGKDGTEQVFEVRPRDGDEWRSKFTSKPADPVHSRMLASGMQVGINQCAKHDQDEVTGHKFHTTAKDSKTWIDDAYDVEEVDDDGPFNGLYFVSKQRLEVDRAERVNVNLLPPGGEIYEMNQRQANLAAVEALLAQVKAHEAMHSVLMKEALDRLVNADRDPAHEIEAEIGPSREAVQKGADGKIRTAETALFEASSEANVKARLKKNPAFQKPVSVWFPRILKIEEKLEDEVKKDLGPLWAIGEE